VPAHRRGAGARFTAGTDNSVTVDRLATDVGRLHETLETVAATTHLPDKPTLAAELHDLVVATRLARR
jgi:hypothetical protein